MIKLYDKIRNIVSANQRGPVTFLFPVYEYYYPIFSDMMMKSLENVFLTSQIPTLPVSII